MAVMPPPPIIASMPRCSLSALSILRKSWGCNGSAHRESREKRNGPPVARRAVFFLRTLAALGDPRLGRSGRDILRLGSLVDLGQGFAAFDGGGGHFGQFGHDGTFGWELLVPP